MPTIIFSRLALAAIRAGLTTRIGSTIMALNINDPDYHKKVADFKAGWGNVANKVNVHDPVLNPRAARHTDASAGNTGKEHLRAEQFGKHAKGNTPNSGSGNQGSRGKPYEGRHEAHYSAGKDIGASVGSTKKAPY